MPRKLTEESIEEKKLTNKIADSDFVIAISKLGTIEIPKMRFNLRDHIILLNNDGTYKIENFEVFLNEED